ncbi:MAG: DNA polymerase/3'-5' exonuclease PolX [Acidobacteriota bacterium]
MDNREVASIFENIANILEIIDDNKFKTNAYHKAAQTIYHLPASIEEYWRMGTLQDIPGIGKAIQSKISEIIETGKLQYHQELLTKVPQGVVNMLMLPGVGPHTIRVIYQNLGIDNFDDLLKAVNDHRIRELPGMGSKTEYNIKKGLELIKSVGESVTLGTVLPLAMDFVNFLAAGEGIEKAELIGSIRRRKPVVHDIDVLSAAADIETIKERVRCYHLLREITSEDAETIKGTLSLGFQFEVIMVSAEEFPLALLIGTGSKAHRARVTAMLAEKGVASGSSEEEIYRALGMDWIAPELREDRGEIEQALKNDLPRLIERADLKGDLHMHSEWSDGGQTLERMVKEARDIGYEYMAITDHSKSLTISRGLNENRLSEQREVIDKLNNKYPEIKVLAGIEVDILKDGSLDFSDEILGQLDVVIASIHSHFNLSKEEQTHRIISAISNPHVDIIGHLTGRLLNRRLGYEVDVEAVLEAAARCNTALEINAHPDRLDISEEVARQARAKGVKVAINSDAHGTGDLALMEYGIYNARRGWLEPPDILNSMNLAQLLDWLKNKPV